MPFPCFMISPIDEARETLRRYTYGKKGDCPVHCWGHHATVELGNVPYTEPYNGRGADDWPHDDPRWPAQCACGYAFAESDQWQHNLSRIYEGNGWRGPLKWGDMPVGAMWDAAWMPDAWKGADGRSLSVCLPDKTDWLIDGPATNGPGWERSGEPPAITARPSIGSSGYHGWLTDGILSDDLEGRTF